MKFNIDGNLIIKHKSFKFISVALIACFMTFAPGFLSISQLRIATMILFSIGLSSSYNLIGGMVGYPSFGHVVFIGAGAYTAAVLVNTYHIPFLISVFLAGINALFLSLVLGAPILRLRGHYFAVVTFAVQMAMAEFVSSIDFLGGGVGLVFKTVYSYKSYYYMFLVASGLTVLSTYFVRRSRLGYGLLAINRNEIRAETLGIPTTSYKMVAFALSAFWPGILGAIFGNYIGFIDTHIAFDPKLSISMVLFCLAGGIGTIMGPVIGAVIISFFNEVLWANLPNFHLMIYGLVLVVFILFFPAEYWVSYEEGVLTNHFSILVIGEKVNLLELRDISKRFGGLTALNNVSLSVNRGEIVGLIGPNGAGKTTIINCITGVIRADAGSIVLNGNDIVNLSPHQIYKLGIGRTFQKIELFPNMTVFESLLVGIQEKTGNSLIERIRPHSAEDWRQVDKILDFLGIAHVAQMSPINISYGQQKLLDLGIALISEPELICLDEPAGGVNPTMIEAIKEHIKKANKAGQTFIIVEHQISLIMDLCDKVIVLDNGKKIMEGTPKEVQENPKVVEAYFGS